MQTPQLVTSVEIQSKFYAFNSNTNCRLTNLDQYFTRHGL